MLRIVGVMRVHSISETLVEEMYLFDAQNRWGYEFDFYARMLGVRVSIRCSESLGL